MSHRRTFSDTAFFNTLKKTKQGPSSSGNSPSNTPSLFFPSLSPPPSLTPPPLSKSTSPTIGVGAIDSSPHHKTSAQEVNDYGHTHMCVLVDNYTVYIYISRESDLKYCNLITTWIKYKVFTTLINFLYFIHC